METVGLIASIGTLCEVGIKIVRTSSKLIKAAKSVHNLEDEILQVALPLKASGQVIHNVFEKFRLRDDGNKNSRVLKLLTRTDIMDTLDDCAQMVTLKLRPLHDDILALDSRFAVIAAFRWQSHKTKFDMLAFMVEQVKTSTMLVIESAQLEILMSLWEKSDERSRRLMEPDIHMLKRTLKQEEESARVLRTKRHRIPDKSDRGFIKSMQRLTESLEPLEQISRETRRTADKLPMPDIHSQEVVNEIKISAPRVVTETRLGRESRNSSPPHPLRVPVAPKNVVPTRQRRQSTQIDPDKGPGSCSSSTSSDASGIIENYLVCDYLKIYGRARGYMAPHLDASPSEVKQVSAFLFRDGEFNSISLRKARELGFTIVKLDAQDPREAHFANVERPIERIVGKVKGAIWWHRLDQPDVSQKLDFWVCEGNGHGHGIRLGERFLKSTRTD